MDLKEFIACTKRIEKLQLSEHETEQRIIRLSDLNRFLNALCIPIVILDKIDFPIVVALNGQKRIGIFFMDEIHKSKCKAIHNTTQYTINQYFIKRNMDEIWIVIVKEKLIDTSKNHNYLNYKECSNNLHDSSKKLFLLDFNRSLLCQIAVNGNEDI